MGAGRETVVSEDTFTRLLKWYGVPVGGALLVWLLKLAAGWLVTLRWVPFKGPLELIDSVPEPWATLGSLGIGLLVGLVFAVMWHSESLTVSVAADRVVLKDGEGRSTELECDTITAVFLDKRDLVLLGPDTEELTRKPCDLSRVALADAFGAHGYPWMAADPHADEYRRWVPDTPGLPPGANALFKAREKELGKSDSDDVKELRGELAKLGVLVRDEKHKQYWRLASRAE